MHRDAVVVLGHRGQKGDDVVSAALQDLVQGEGAVLASAPGHEYLGLHRGNSYAFTPNLLMIARNASALPTASSTAL